MAENVDFKMFFIHLDTCLNGFFIFKNYSRGKKDENEKISYN
jgi:hypothetical protein